MVNTKRMLKLCGQSERFFTVSRGATLLDNQSCLLLSYVELRFNEFDFFIILNACLYNNIFMGFVHMHANK